MLRVLSREFVRVAVAACATDVDFFVVCAFLFVTAFIGSTLLFVLLLYCASHFVPKFQGIFLLATFSTITTHNHSFFKNITFLPPFFAFLVHFPSVPCHLVLRSVFVPS